MSKLRLVNGKWIDITGETTPKDKNERNLPKEDLSISQYISKHGGIKSNIDGSIHTSKRSYLNHIKQNNCVIKDWK